MADRPDAPAANDTRRGFLRGLFRKTGEAALRGAEALAGDGAPRFARPPGALMEGVFLASCTRCGDCVGACPHGTVFLLGSHTGAAAGTPALDLSNGACHLCADWPCVAACEPGALRPVEVAEVRLARVRIDRATCLPFLGPECGVCVAVCPVPGALTLRGTLPALDGDLCTGCALCREACVVQPPAVTLHPLKAG